MGVTLHEERDLSFKAIVLFAVSLVVAGVLVHGAAVGLFRYLASRPARYPPPSPLAGPGEEVVGPRLLVNPSREMKKLRAAENAALNQYEWIDREHGVVRIPIDRAIELLAQHP